MLGADPAHAQATAVTFLTHDGDDDHEDESVRRAIAMLVAADRDRFDRHALLYLCIATGKPQSFNVLQALNLDTTEACKQMAQILRNVKTSRAAALKTLSFTGLHGPEIRPALEPLLEDPDEALRLAAATLLDRKDVLARMRVPELLRDLRSDVIDRRMIAARRLDDLGVEPKEITGALLRAVDRRDMPAREGLIAALEAAHASHKPTLEVLQRTADASDPAPRAYARAALREIAAAR
jgi:hypothetical protein